MTEKARLYTAWKNMRQRCVNENRKDYPAYGGRGIAVCPEWQNSFPAFMAWALETGYQDGLTIDRIDTNGQYCPENCRWATKKEQANNRRSNRVLTMGGKSQTMQLWADELGIEASTLRRRLYCGWPVERALQEPIHIEKRKKSDYQRTQ